MYIDQVIHELEEEITMQCAGTEVLIDYYTAKEILRTKAVKVRYKFWVWLWGRWWRVPRWVTNKIYRKQGHGGNLKRTYKINPNWGYYIRHFGKEDKE